MTACRDRGVGLALAGIVLAGLTGCGGADLVPVRGRVLVDGAPLTTGTVLFHPDAGKGTTSRQIPQGDLDAQGNYTLSTGTKPGAPRGWYRVTVYAAKPFDPAKPYAPEEWLIPRKYGEPQQAGLTVQVVENAGDGAYDLKLRGGAEKAEAPDETGHGRKRNVAVRSRTSILNPEKLCGFKILVVCLPRAG